MNQPETSSFRSALNPVVVRLGIVSFFADVASEMLYPITPIFITVVLGSSVMSVGVIEGFAEGIASLLKTYFGRLSDKSGNRKTFVWVGYLCGAIAKPLIGSAGSWLHVFSARGLDRVGKGLRTAPRDALLAEAVEPSLRGAAFGFHRGMDTLGAVVGPLLAILLINQSQEPEYLRTVYYIAFIPALLAVFVAMSLKAPHQEPKKIQTASKVRLPISRSFRTYLFAWGAFSLANSSDVFLLLKAQKSGLSLTMTIILYAFYNLLYALSSPFFGHLSDKINRKHILTAGLAIFALIYIGFGFATETWHFWGLFAFYGLYMGATDGVGKAYAVDLVPPEAKATGLGILGTVTGLTTIFASSVAGFLWDRLGANWTFFYGALGATVAIAILLFVPERVRENYGNL